MISPVADETEDLGTCERQNTQRVAVPVPSPLTGVCLPVETRWKPGVSANPGGRPKVNRTVSSALAELQDTEGEDPEAIVAAFKARRGARLCGADHKAIAIFRTELDAGGRTQISAVDTVLDRLEGKVAQAIDVSGSLDVGAAIAAAHAAATGESERE